MTLFLLTFFLLYGGMHLYAFLKAKVVFAFGIYTGISVAFFMLIMFFAPFIIRLSEKAGFEVFARLMSYVGYTWLGILFLFVSGRPLGEPVAWYGPIVMNTQEELRIAFEEFRNGTFIK